MEWLVLGVIELLLYFMPKKVFFDILRIKCCYIRRL